MREIVHVDIANDPIATADYRETEDPTKYEKLSNTFMLTLLIAIFFKFSDLNQ